MLSQEFFFELTEHFHMMNDEQLHSPLFGAITRRALFDGVVLDSSLLRALVSGIPFTEDNDDDVDNEENADAYNAVDNDENADADDAVENADAADAVYNGENADAADVDNDDDADATVDNEDRRGKN